VPGDRPRATERSDLHNRQPGFMAGRTTIDALNIPVRRVGGNRNYDHLFLL
jgi:hypothetical protein